MMNSFILDLESQTVSCDEYRKHEETLLKYSIVNSNTINLSEYISLNPLSSNKTGRFLCKLADKHGIIITGKAEPFWVGPSKIKLNVFFRGMPMKRLLKWYEHYGFIIKENNEIIRYPK